MHEKKLVFQMVWSREDIRCVVGTAFLFRRGGSEFSRSFPGPFLVLLFRYRASGFRLGVFRVVGGNPGDVLEPSDRRSVAAARVLSPV